jgi:aqualysin 1
LCKYLTRRLLVTPAADTGINIALADFGGRAVWGATFTGNSDADANGHGTAVAGGVGGTVYGVAKGVRLIAVKVLGDDGSGTTSNM